MQFTALIASSIIAFAAAAPMPAPTDYSNVDLTKVDYSGVDWTKVDYSGVDWSKVDYSGVNWATVNYGAAPTKTASIAAPVATTKSSSSASSTSTSTASDGPFGFLSIRSGDINLHYQPLYVNSTLRVGGTPPASYSPAGVNVPTTTQAAFTVSNDQMALAVAVPGGQQMYVNADGTIGRTQPHSATIPDGASRIGFSIDTSFDLEYNSKAQFVACPVSGASAVYEVVVSEKTSRQDCTGISVRGTKLENYAGAFEWL